MSHFFFLPFSTLLGGTLIAALVWLTGGDDSPQRGGPAAGIAEARTLRLGAVAASGPLEDGVGERLRPDVFVSGGGEHRFGVLAQHAAGAHAFEIENLSGRELTFVLEGTSCGCTQVKFNGERMLAAPSEPPPARIEATPVAATAGGPQRSVLSGPVALAASEPAALDLFDAEPAAPEPPAQEFRLAAGQKARVELAWETRDAAGAYRQSARLLVSSLRQPFLVLAAEGEVAVATASPAR